MKKILYYAKGNQKYMFSAIICLLVSTLFSILPFYFLNNIIISLLQGNFILSASLKDVLYIGISLVLKALFFGGGLGLSHIGAFNTLFNVRTTFAENMAYHPMGHILSEGTGKYKKTFVEDISSLEGALAHMIPEGLPYIFGVIITIICIFIADYRLGLSVIVMIPLSMSPMAFMMKVGLEKMPQFYESRDNLNHALVEYVSGMEVVKIFNKTNESFSNITNTVNNAKEFTLEWCRVTWKAMSVLYSLLPCTLLIPLPLGIYLYLNQHISLANLTLVIMLALSLGEPLIKLINFMPSIPMLSFALKKAEDVFVTDEVKTGTFNEKLDNNDIEFNNVRFGYSNKDVINNLSLKIPQNSICALVGHSGSGKSTLAKLLVHFWDVKSGEITIGGKNINDFTYENLNSHISYVSQENTLFDTTVYENIAIAKNGISKEEVIEACKKANCHDFIMNLEHGYDTLVGTLGGKLSGGERQRITIARAIIKDAPIIVLDEATAFADAENEFLIQEALSKLLVNKTVIIIAHKLHTIVDADQIVVLNQGQVEMVAKHHELLEKSATYQKLWRQNELSVNWDLGGDVNV